MFFFILHLLDRLEEKIVSKSFVFSDRMMHEEKTKQKVKQTEVRERE